LGERGWKVLASYATSERETVAVERSRKDVRGHRYALRLDAALRTLYAGAFLGNLGVAENELGTEKDQKINRRILTFMMTPMANIMEASAEPP